MHQRRKRHRDGEESARRCAFSRAPQRRIAPEPPCRRQPELQEAENEGEEEGEGAEFGDHRLASSTGSTSPVGRPPKLTIFF